MRQHFQPDYNANTIILKPEFFTAGASAISNWTVTWTFANGQTISQAWNATVTSQGAAVTARNVSYNGTLAPGASTAFGFLASVTGANSVPTLTCTAS